MSYSVSKPGCPVSDWNEAMLMHTYCRGHILTREMKIPGWQTPKLRLALKWQMKNQGLQRRNLLKEHLCCLQIPGNT